LFHVPTSNLEATHPRHGAELALTTKAQIASSQIHIPQLSRLVLCFRTPDGSMHGPSKSGYAVCQLAKQLIKDPVQQLIMWMGIHVHKIVMVYKYKIQSQHSSDCQTMPRNMEKPLQKWDGSTKSHQPGV